MEILAEDKFRFHKGGPLETHTTIIHRYVGGPDDPVSGQEDDSDITRLDELKESRGVENSKDKLIRNVTRYKNIHRGARPASSCRRSSAKTPRPRSSSSRESDVSSEEESQCKDFDDGKGHSKLIRNVTRFVRILRGHLPRCD
jgi:hypothetical protein